MERGAYVLSTAHADYVIEEDGDGVRTLRVNGQNASGEDGAGTGHPYIEWIEDEVYGSLSDGPGGAGAGDRRRGFHVRPRAGGERLRRSSMWTWTGASTRSRTRFLGPRHGAGPMCRWTAGRTCCDKTPGSTPSCWTRSAIGTTMPAHLVTREFFALARSRLEESGGTLYMNLIVPPGPERLATRIERTLRTVFAWCRTQAAGEFDSGGTTSCSSATRSDLDGDATVYSDDVTRGEADVWRERGGVHGGDS